MKKNLFVKKIGADKYASSAGPRHRKTENPRHHEDDPRDGPARLRRCNRNGSFVCFGLRKKNEIHRHFLFAGPRRRRKPSGVLAGELDLVCGDHTALPISSFFLRFQ